MTPRRLLSLALPLLALALPQAQAQAASSAEILAQSSASDWRRPDPDNLLLMQLPGGPVLIELAPAFAPRHVANIQKLARERYYDGLAVVRVQDNYVAQWGDPQAEDATLRRPMIEGQPQLPGEFSRPIAGLELSPLPDGDVYAPGVGYYQGFPVASSRKLGRAWLAHCYGMVGAGRGDTADSGSGAELYAVIGHAPRHLDRNVTLVGRVLQGMENLSSLPRGHGPLGFYLPEEANTPIRSLQKVGELPPEQRPKVEVLRTDTATWKAYVEARRTRREDWFLEPTGRIELCNVPAPVRVVAP
ncbi:peptidylprolyl isomerase [Stagnimonas aquatica]|uniref:peptidylprolyl isomerase n=1 Tax=Stagnimonas aquatica TaxID=2689987 RepID=A0A3N0VG03_9GAMM|nr:peptidylprolyl isomerase [Stagnimonas aquatica]ROH91198.1 peptidylprolyl isomerase [Stagnimonas aquatica]